MADSLDAINLKLLGDEELDRKLARLATPASQKRAIRPSLKKSAQRLKEHLITNLSGRIVTPRTGRWLAATKAAKVKALPRARQRIGSGFATPTREELGIPADAPGYYPFAVEYGTPTAPAYAPMRRDVNEHTLDEHRHIGKGIGEGIKKEALKSA